MENISAIATDTGHVGTRFGRSGPGWAEPSGDLENSLDRGPSADAPGNWWFDLDPTPRFLVNTNAHVLGLNLAGRHALEDGRLAASAVGALEFGSRHCDGRLLAAVHQVVRTGGQRLVILRQRTGGWLAGDVQGIPDRGFAMLGLREEVAPTPQVMAAMADAFQLTKSELEVLRCVLGGLCPKTVAIDLGISEHTVRAHLRGIYAKLGVRGLTNTIRMASALLG